MGDPEAELVQELKEEKPGAFEKLFRSYWRRIMALALAAIPDTAEAEDAAIETFADIARGIKKFRGEAKLSTYIYRIAMNRIAKHTRTRARTIPTIPISAELENAATTRSLEEEQEIKDEVIWLLKEINLLPRLQRQAVTLRHLLGLSLPEVAETLGVSTEVAGMRINRGINRLRRIRQRCQKRSKR
ncbi:MAG: sigma-70 family RNA polymerase sigma factor [candidate division WOR-3 bacterium]